ncbi:MAG: hypothetical protein JNL67_20195 [Planctomycetaceae bacterium]|nr:hypothetical protein [Planctomycetaceae bacterium]
MVIYLTRDLMFSSRVRPLVERRGLTLKMASSVEDCVNKLAVLLPPDSGHTEDAVYLLVDLKAIADPTELPPLLSAVQAACNGRFLRTLAYGPHVHETWLAAANHAGFDSVMTQGQFDRGFDQWLSETPFKNGR